MRKAFESDYVSEHLSDWIDLFFGYKQTDPDNSYPPEMYESIWTKQTLNDPARRAEIEAAMCHIGQLPPIVFNSPHPKRNVRKTTSTLSQTVIVDLSLGPVATALWRSKREFVYVRDRELHIFSVDFAAGAHCVHSESVDLPGSVSGIGSGRKTNVSILFATGRMMTFDGDVLSPLFPELSNISVFAASNRCFAVVSDAAMLNLVGPRLNFAIPFYGNPISCCDISHHFGIAVCGVAGSIVISALFEGTKLNVVTLGADYKPMKVLITRSWGFIVTYAAVTIAGKTTNRLFVHTVNGKLIRAAPITFSITAWCTWKSRRGFDFVMVANDLGKLSVFEAFYLNIGESFHRCCETAVTVTYRPEHSVAVVVLRDGHVVFVPYKYE
jgi:hypothetical protein